MIHILTIHWKSEKWIDIQLKYIEHFIDEPYRIYAYLNDVENVEEHRDKFYYVSTDHIKSHSQKLNLLAENVANDACPSDVLMFLDGDAFPISPLSPFIKDKLSQYPLAAVQRKENYGDIQPHPCFCITKLAYWKTIQGDWQSGNVTWQDTLGNDVRDIGGVLMQKLNDRRDSWYKLLRTNTVDQDHPVLFGMYDDLIYHHGAGFRSPVMRADSNTVKFLSLKKHLFSFFSKILPKPYAIKYFGPYRKLKIENKLLSENMYSQIQDNFHFFKNL